ncbi:MAG: hypothetical protein IPK19_09845 [Chloroflexi bacterium]|nr:hypothetical protein [Chloroflexota bacterium]
MDASATGDEDFPWDSLSEFAESEAEESSSTEGDLPDWLRESSPLDLSGAASPPVASESSEPSEFDWLTEEAIEGASASFEDAAAVSEDKWLTDFPVTAEAPLPMDAEPSTFEAEPTAAEVDWLSELTAQEPLDETETPEAPAGVPVTEPEVTYAVADADLAWLSELEDLPADAVAMGSAAGSEVEEQLEEAVPDWLSEMQTEAEATAVAVPEAAVSAIDEDTFDWLNTLPEAELPTGAEEPLEETPTPIAEEPISVESAALEPAEAAVPDWLAGLETSSELSAPAEGVEDLVSEVSEVGEPTGEWDEDEFAWELTTPEEPSPVETTPQQEQVAEMFGVGPEDSEPEDDSRLVLGAATAGAAMSLEGATDDEDEDLFAVSEETSFEEEPSFEEEFEETYAVSQDPFGTEEPAEEGFEFAAASLHDEAVAPTPAENAPDWLNAMVPGIDVDYEEQENVLPDEEFEEVVETPIPVHEAEEATEFAWLERIVAEELASDSAPMPALPRFVFSRQPAWTRQAQPDDDFPDWVLDEDE